MKIYKFGGASVKDAEAVENVLKVLRTTGDTDLVIVVSAIGKTTNALEQVVKDYLEGSSNLDASISVVYDFHDKILNTLFPGRSHPVFDEVNGLFKQIRDFLATNKSHDQAFVYDQVVSMGELISTRIVSAFLEERGITNHFLDARGCIVTDANFRDARVDWADSKSQIVNSVSKKGITVTQGFIASENQNNFTTTLGREGSDYTAAIFGFCLDAESVIIWKDVPGVLNADPRYFKDTQLLQQISYREAIELAFYGASVIHPKTLQPLQRKEIPLLVKPFFNPTEEGTRVGKGVALDPMLSCFILKKDQVLISLSSLDFSFMAENHIGDVFNLLHECRMKVALIQNSAISFSVCVDNKFDKLQPLLNKLREKYRVKWNENVTLYTVRHSKPSEIEALTDGKTVLLKQESRETVQLVIKE